MEQKKSRSRGVFLKGIRASLFLFFGCLIFFTPRLVALDWQELKGDHFIVYYGADEAFARAVLRKAEYCYSRVASDLGYVRYANFWQWDKRVKIMIYPDQSSFLSATGQPSWSIGNANYSKKEISSFAGCERFVEETLPHEITHLIFRDFVGFRGQVPLWLDEGVAQWQEPSKKQVVRFLVRQLYDQKKLLTLQTLTHTDVRQVSDDQAAQNFYVQSASLVGFLIDKYGTERFAELCRQLRDGKSLNDALRFVYPSQMRDLSELEDQWLAHVSGIQAPARKVNKDGRKVIVL